MAYRRGNESGVALLTALGLLIVFVMLGSAFITFMNLELDKTRLDVQAARTREAARGGVSAGVGELQAALAAARPPNNAMHVDFPIYRAAPDTAARDDMQVGADITIAADAPGTWRIASTGVCGKVGPNKKLYHTRAIMAEATVAVGKDSVAIVSWSEHPANESVDADRKK